MDPTFNPHSDTIQSREGLHFPLAESRLTTRQVDQLLQTCAFDHSATFPDHYMELREASPLLAALLGIRIISEESNMGSPRLGTVIPHTHSVLPFACREVLKGLIGGIADATPEAPKSRLGSSVLNVLSSSPEPTNLEPYSGVEFLREIHGITTARLNLERVIPHRCFFARHQEALEKIWGAATELLDSQQGFSALSFSFPRAASSPNHCEQIPDLKIAALAGGEVPTIKPVPGAVGAITPLLQSDILGLIRAITIGLDRHSIGEKHGIDAASRKLFIQGGLATNVDGILNPLQRARAAVGLPNLLTTEP